ncbi:PilZ domain-containing protein [Thermithiobacillus plumbiphilus]|uniref:PilZ domain-containing protein n=1 Tax=Thermithiobacillus plumbiphilus TaxID=1729899 RepID=A0ABU9D4D4_9PROT
MSTQTPEASRSAVISVQFKDVLSVYDHFMPKVKGGGLFIETSKPYALGDELFILLTLPDNGPRVPVAGRVIWVSPAGSRDGRAPGVGIQFTGDQSSLNVRIQNLLLTAPVADRPNRTF